MEQVFEFQIGVRLGPWSTKQRSNFATSQHSVCHCPQIANGSNIAGSIPALPKHLRLVLMTDTSSSAAKSSVWARRFPSVWDVIPIPNRMPKNRRSSLADQLPVPVKLIERRIYLVRGHKVMLDSDLPTSTTYPLKRVTKV